MVNITGLASLALVLATSYVVDASALTSEQVRTMQNDFKKPTMDSGVLFTDVDNFRKHTPELFTDLTSGHYTEMFKRLGSLTNATDAYALITENDMRNIQKERANCRHFRKAHIENFKTETIKVMNWECLEQVLKQEEFPDDKLHLIDNTAFKNGMLAIVKQAAGVESTDTRAGGVFGTLNKSQINLMAESKNEEVWGEIGLEQLMASNISDRPAKFKSLNPEAYSKFTGHGKVELSKDVLKLLPANIFAKVKRDIHPGTMANMTRDQLANFGKNRKGTGKCKNLDLEHSPVSGLSQIEPDCYASYLENVTADKAGSLGKNFGKLADGIFSGVKDFYNFGKLNDDDWFNMRRPHLDYIVKNHPEACQFIPSGMADSKNLGNLHPNARCFQFLKPENQTGLLAKHLKDMPKDVLSGVTSDNVREWSHTKGSSFSFIEGIKLEPEYLAHLGSALETSDHPCILFDSKDELLSKKHLMKHMGPHCFSALTILSEFDEKAMKEFPARVYALSTPDVILKNAPGFFANVDSVTMGLMVKNGNFCANVDSKTLSTIPSAAFSTMTYKCMQDMQKNVSLISEGQLSFLPEETVKSIDAEMAKSLTSIAPFKAPQLKVLNAAAFSTATKEVVAKLTVEQLAVLSAEQMAAIPAAAFAGFTTKEQIAAIRPEALVKIVYEQIKEVKEEALTALSPAQIRSLGTSVTDAAKRPTKVLTPTLISKLSKESAEAAKEVLANGAMSLRVSAGALAVLGAVALLI